MYRVRPLHQVFKLVDVSDLEVSDGLQILVAQLPQYALAQR